ncbi:uncharacterized protein [Hetaerina americana]|uniref:uncharacterized protein n=1 Tax=Hetaerina americana TaxID=62018 RepID=UPI003A7F1FD3
MASTNLTDVKPRVLVLGGCGFIGRNLVEFLVDNDLVSSVTVVDKVPPQTAWLNRKHQEIFDSEKVTFKSANLIIPASCENAFLDEGNPIDFVVNCAGETKYGQTDPVYREGILKLSLNCANQAAKLNVKRYIEISSGHVYSNDKAAHKESAKVEPWTFVAKYKLMVEEDLKNVTGLNYAVVRPAIVYGKGDKNGIVPRLVTGAVYRQLGEMMRLLWTKDLAMNTIHVRDVCRAVWLLCQRYADGGATQGQTFNLVDLGDTTQGCISAIVSEIFNINHDYVGSMLSSVYKTDMATVVDEINDKHVGPWADACSTDGIENTPLTPYLDAEMLTNHHLRLDGTNLISAVNFVHDIPKINKDSVKEILDDYVEMRLFPKSLVL